MENTTQLFTAEQQAYIDQRVKEIVAEEKVSTQKLSKALSAILPLEPIGR